MLADEYETTVLDRLMEAFGVLGMMQLAAFLDEKPATVSDWKRCGRVPESFRDKLAELGICLEWVNTGRGKKYC